MALPAEPMVVLDGAQADAVAAPVAAAAATVPAGGAQSTSDALQAGYEEIAKQLVSMAD